MRHRSAVLLLVITSVLWSLGGVLLKQVEWHPMAKAGARSAIAAMVILAWMRRPKFSWSPNQLLGAAAYVGTVSFFVISTDLTTAANAIFLLYTAPAYVAVLGAWMLGERTHARDWACIALAVAGVGLLCRDGLAANNVPGVDADGFHQTDTVDYVFILDGDVTLELDDSSVVLHPGDCVVQRATNHAWRNHGDTPIRLLAVMVALDRAREKLAQRLKMKELKP